MTNGDLPAAQHAALRRIAALATAKAPAADLFGAVVREITTVLELPRGWLFRYEPVAEISVLASVNFPPFSAGSRWPLDGPSMAATILEIGRPVRVDDHSGLESTIARRVRELGVLSMCGVPIRVDGGIWGGIGVSPQGGELLPVRAPDRLAAFTELVAGVISGAASQDRLARLADHRTSLSRIATLVAEELPAAELLAAIMAEATRVLGASAMFVGRYEAGDAMTVVASVDAPRFPVGSRWPHDGPNLSALVYETGRPTRIDEYSEPSSRLAVGIRESGLGSAIGVPILAAGRIWGIGCVAMRGTGPLPAGTEDRLQDFTDLLGLAIANAESRRRTRRLAAEQAALRRVATLVAEGAGPAELFSAVADEVARVLDVAAVWVVRFESGTTSIVVASRDDADLPVGSRASLDRPGLAATVFETGRPARRDENERSSAAAAEVAVPIMVDGRVWGMIAVALRSSREARPAHAGILTSRLVLSDASAHEVESRLAAFTELVATAISKAQMHDDLRTLADEQAALRRVATLVAHGAAPAAVFDAVTAETAALLGADGVMLCRYADGDEITMVAHHGPAAGELPLGSRIGRVPGFAELLGARAAVEAPVTIGGRAWGLIVPYWRGGQPPEADPEPRLSQFAELLDTAIANADSHDQLTASRARVLIAADEARRRVVRDLHDGAQQRLIEAILTLELARARAPSTDPERDSLVADALEQLQQGVEGLRELAHGVLPRVLTNFGLKAGLTGVVTRLDLPVDVDVPAARYPAEIEASAYFIVVEALTNVSKHARASRAEVRVAAEGGVLRIEVRDDGIGGADASGHGLVGLEDRVTTLGGRFELKSPRGGGTALIATLPLPFM
ncbi:GAF domain-containing protein [Solirubrobacter ginsenosidimutans]|uniref:histidine kinase n=1 Tax=Solirubrobacter ginsenosidimutans TaxID=490573 RepID=A0A9X3MNS5_9ACTN|nr:GAF domain-containing protein [Solirubrobacter ginsenosidimutans]MDA0159859.1 GAF domain-containing protein [Solirubrobacter ginsenosidimutans]